MPAGDGPTGSLLTHGDFFYEETVDIFQECDNILSRTPVEKRKEYRSLTTSEELIKFFMVFNLSTHAMQYLLDMLKRLDLKDCPASLYHLLKEHRTKLSALDVSRNENFIYIGIENTMKYLIDNDLLHSSDSNSLRLKMQINIDGLPLYKSSSVNLWPILLKTENVQSPMPIGLFFGRGKPNLSAFLKDLCEELQLLSSSGIKYKNTIIRSNEVLFICDAPARAYLQCIKGHNAYEGCGYCTQVGYRHQDSTVFQTRAGTPRSDVNYANNEESNQINLSPLACIIPLRQNFPPDYMHCVLLGVTRKLLFYYFTSTRNMRLQCKLSVRQQYFINEHVSSLRKYVPQEFQRKIRTFSDLHHFKAVEYRMYLLYFGPIVLKKYLPVNYYHHFLLLHFAMYVMCSSTLNHLLPYASSCIDLFVHQMVDLFGPQSVVYNVHCLLHLHEYVNMYGPLDSFSAFRFENYLGVLKRRIKTTSNIFQHSFNQLICVRDIYSSLSKPKSLFFSNSSPNNCAILEGNIFILVELVSDGRVSGHKLSFVKSIYEYPYESSFLNIGYYKKSSVYLHNRSPLSKAICIPTNSEYIVMPFVE